METGEKAVQQGQRTPVGKLLLAFLICLALVATMCCSTAYHDGVREATEQYENELKAQETEKDTKIQELERQLVPLTEDGLITNRMVRFYGCHPTDMAPEFYSDAEFREYCEREHPEAVYPSNAWTTEEVIQSWLEQPEIWGHYEDYWAYNDTWFTWTPDHQYCFILDVDEPFSLTDPETSEHQELISGWLVVNGAPVAMLDKETYDIEDPYELIRQYQAGEWDGNIRRSHDGSTTVRIYAHGDSVDYEFQIWQYDERFDPEGLAWTGYVAEPWWKRGDLSPELLVAVGEERAQAMEPWTAMNAGRQAWLYLPLCVDLPLHYDINKVECLMSTTEGTLCKDAGQLMLYNNGKLRAQWTMWFQADSMMLYKAPRYSAAEYAENVFYIRDQQKNLTALRLDGTTEVVLDEIVWSSRASSTVWGLKDGELMCWGLGSWAEDWQPDRFDVEVAKVDTASGSLLVEAADGTCYVMVYDDDKAEYRMKQLGTEPLEYYLEIYQMIKDGRYLLV